MGKKKHEGHHGGAWKVAYADFVTAMMALFMVLWIVGQKKEIVEATAKYFKNPIASKYESIVGDETLLGEGGLDKEDTDQKIDLEVLKKLAEEIYKALKIEEKDHDKPIEIFITPNGLKIFIYNLAKKPLFKKQKAILTDWGDLIVQSLAWLLDRRSAHMLLVSYDPQLIKKTQEDQLALRMKAAANGQTSWDLCLARGQVIYKRLVYYGFSLGKLSSVTGNLNLPSGARHCTEMIELSLNIKQDG